MSSTTFEAINRLAKWRLIFAGWQLGSRPKGDPEGDAVRDHREATIMLRAEVNAMTGLLLEKGVFTIEEWDRALELEARRLDADYSRRFPGVTTDMSGLRIDPVKAQGWLKNFRP